MAQSSICDDDMKTLLEKYLETASKLYEKCREQLEVKGSQKLLKKCKAELTFLQGLSGSRDVKTSQVKSSNLTHLQGILDAMETLPGVQMVLQPFNSPNQHVPLLVDIVCNYGYTWVKITARNAQALHLKWAGDGQFGVKNIVEQAKEYLECSRHHLYNYRQPQIVFIFTAGITRPLQRALEDMGVTVYGSQVAVSDEVQKQLQDIEIFDPVTGSSLCSDDDKNEETPGNAVDLSDKDKGSELSKYGNHLQRERPPETRGECQRISNGPKLEKSETIFHANMDKIKSTSSNSRQPLDCHFNVEINKFSNEEYSSHRDHCDIPLQMLPSDSCSDANTLAGNVSQFMQISSQPDIGKVNLDITTLIALVSNVCHGCCNFIFEEDILSDQAAQERSSPVLPRLNAFLKDKDMYACKSAIKDFRTILDTIGGEQECKRFEELMTKVTVVDDQPSSRALSLQESAKIKKRGKTVFGTGDTLQAMTVTANIGFVRAAKNQGVPFSVFLHEPRVLTEQKERKAKPLPSS